MNQSDSGWRKRQIALNKKAENARELGLDYEPSKTVVDMAREAGFEFNSLGMTYTTGRLPELLERLLALARAEEREECAKLCDWLNGEPRLTPIGCAAAIRARGQA